MSRALLLAALLKVIIAIILNWKRTTIIGPSAACFFDSCCSNRRGLVCHEAWQSYLAFPQININGLLGVVNSVSKYMRPWRFSSLALCPVVMFTDVSPPLYLVIAYTCLSLSTAPSLVLFFGFLLFPFFPCIAENEKAPKSVWRAQILYWIYSSSESLAIGPQFTCVWNISGVLVQDK